jgi:NAD(P)-dependent dehydrogenase (short-subunit alcohol dehydrogenase family)
MQTILVTGANRGIGLGFVQYYLSQGERVFATYRARGERLFELQLQYPERLTIVALDVTDYESIEAARGVVGDVTQSLDVLLNNAGVFFPSESFKEATGEGLLESFRVNAIAPLRMAKRFVDLLEAGNNPRLVNITMPTPPLAKLTRTANHSYVASRYALNALTKMLALELAEKGIITAALWPGFLRTDMNNMNLEATPVAEGIPAAAKVIDSLTMEHNGTCLLPDGKIYDW